MIDKLLMAMVWACTAVAAIVLCCAVYATFLATTGQNQSTCDITSSYDLPVELSGCKVHRITPAGFGTTLYVISRDGDPQSVEWDEHHGKTHTRRRVVMP